MKMKKLNNHGFAISTLLYGLMIMSLLVILALISNLGTNRKNTTTLVDKIEDELNRLSLSDTEGEYTGGEIDDNGREYIAPSSGWYKIELFGAAGGGSNGGRGSYVSGIMYLELGDVLYFYVGEKGDRNATFNGGGAGSGSNYAGGGATDVRLISGTWNEEESLESRIMVAAGGGGGSSVEGGRGSTLVGGYGVTANNSDPTKATGGTQSAGGNHGTGSKASGTSGSFGIGGTGGANLSGGGGGYYGGGASGAANSYLGSGGGGSSFIAGYAGAQTRINGTVQKAPNRTYTIHRGKYEEPIYDSEGNLISESSGEAILESYTPTIHNGLMIPGVNDGAGKFKITKVSDNDINNLPKKESNQKLKQVQYIQDCVEGYGNQTTGYWLEIQAIQNGQNVALGKTVSGNGGTAKNLNVITDGVMDKTTSVGEISGSGTKCVQIDLGSKIDLDEIAVWHQYDDNGTQSWEFKNHTLSVSSDKSTWQTIISKSSDTNATGILGEKETSNGIRYNTFKADFLGELTEGNYYILSANSDNLALTSTTESDNNFAKMDYFTGEKTQIWHVYKQQDASGNTYYRIVDNSTNLALEVSDDTGNAGVMIDLFENNINNTAQNWNISSLGTGYYTITSQKGIRMGYNTTSTIVETQTTTQKKEQRWKFVLAGY